MGTIRLLQNSTLHNHCYLPNCLRESIERILPLQYDSYLTLLQEGFCSGYTLRTPSNSPPSLDFFRPQDSGLQAPTTISIRHDCARATISLSPTNNNHRQAVGSSSELLVLTSDARAQSWTAPAALPPFYSRSFKDNRSTKRHH